MVEVFMTYDHQLSEFCWKLVCWLKLGAGVNFFLLQHLRMVVIVQFEKHMSGVCIFSIVISELYHWLDLGPVVLLLIHKDTKVNFYCAILLFCLLVRLRVKRGGKSALYAKKVTKQQAESGHEYRFAVTDNGVCEAIM